MEVRQSIIHRLIVLFAASGLTVRFHRMMAHHVQWVPFPTQLVEARLMTARIAQRDTIVLNWGWNQG